MKFEHFLRRSKRIKNVSDIHIRVIRVGQKRLFYRVDMDTKESEFIEERNRENAYDQRSINRLIEKERKKINVSSCNY